MSARGRRSVRTMNSAVGVATARRAWRARRAAAIGKSPTPATSTNTANASPASATVTTTARRWTRVDQPELAATRGTTEPVEPGRAARRWRSQLGQLRAGGRGR